MSDYDALLAAILAEPAEDMPRLLLAEWLDENAGTVECKQCWGDPKANIRFDKATWRYRWDCPTCSGTGRVSDGRAERAEFIRVQCELARRTPYVAPPEILEIANSGRLYANQAADLIGEQATEHAARTGDLRRRERELWNLPLIFRELPDSSEVEILLSIDPSETLSHGGICGLVSRGFVSALTCTWTAWREHADAILKAQPVERVRLTTPTGIDYFDSGGEMLWIPGWPEGRVVDREDLPFKEGDSDEMAYLRALWPRITFELPAEQPSQRVPPPIFPPPIRR